MDVRSFHELCLAKISICGGIKYMDWVANSDTWVVQQLREAFTYDSAAGYLIFEHGFSFNAEMRDVVRSFGIQPKRTSFRSPRQSGVAERWVGNCRRDLLDHAIVCNEWHLKRLMNDYVGYYHEDRTHPALAKGMPAGREAKQNSDIDCKVMAMPRLGGLHHRYDLAALADAARISRRSRR